MLAIKPLGSYLFFRPPEKLPEPFERLPDHPERLLYHRERILETPDNHLIDFGIFSTLPERFLWAREIFIKY
jgi:hypothetical protein